VKRIFQIAVYLCFLWNLILVVGVTLNASYAFDRAVGGQFEGFPNWVRALYILTTIVVISQAYTYFLASRGIDKVKTGILKFFFLLGLLSSLANLLSRSEPERINAIAAFIITVAFYNLLRKKRIHVS